GHTYIDTSRQIGITCPGVYLTTTTFLTGWCTDPSTLTKYTPLGRPEASSESSWRPAGRKPSWRVPTRRPCTSYNSTVTRRCSPIARITLARVRRGLG